MAEERCPSCNKPLSDKIVMLPENMIELIKLFAPTDNYHLCTRCGGGKLYTASTRISFSGADEGVQELKKSFPLLSLPMPLGWQYEPISLVTATTVTGAGAMTEIGASMDATFGGSSPAFASKIGKGVEACSDRLIANAMALNANAVIDVDIDYSEMGGGRGLIMVSMAGTAVVLKNLDILGEQRTKDMKALMQKLRVMSHIEALRREYQAFSKQYKVV
jgi:uncharacterized protein YbjQ (UPF0145 family)